MRALALLASFGAAHAARVPGSPFPLPAGGLNASRELLVLHTDGLAADDQILAATLQGAASAAGPPAVYRYSRGSDYELWANVTAAMWGVTLNTSLAGDLAGVLAAVAPSLRGYVRYAPTDAASVGAAVAACAALRAVAVSPRNEPLAVAAGLRLLADATGRDVPWAIASFNGTAGFAYSRHVTTVQDPAKAACMSDYSIATGALQWWVPTDGTPLAARVWASMAPPFAALGWGPTERGTVAAASRAGGGVVASDWATNLDALSAFDVPAFVQKPAPPPPPPPPAAVHTACFLMSDGDNVQWLLGGFARDPAHFGSPDRGRVAMGWTVSPAVADLAPAMLAHVYAGAADGTAPGHPARDVFVAGVSGASYFYPDDVPAGAPLAAAGDLTAAYMAKAGLRIANVMTDGNVLSATAAGAYLRHDGVDALLWYPYDDYAGAHGSIAWVGGKPVIGGRFSLWGDGTQGVDFKNVTGAAAALLAGARDPTSPAGYSLIPLHAWSHNVSDALAVAQLVAAGGGGVEFVTPDVLVARVVANVKH